MLADPRTKGAGVQLYTFQVSQNFPNIYGIQISNTSFRYHMHVYALKYLWKEWLYPLLICLAP